MHCLKLMPSLGYLWTNDEKFISSSHTMGIPRHTLLFFLPKPDNIFYHLLNLKTLSA